MNTQIFFQKKSKQAARPSRPLRRELCGLLCLALALCVLCGAGSVVLTPKRKDCGALWRQYRKEDKSTISVLFFGSSMAYCDVAPAVIFEQSGIPTYVMAGPDQTMRMTARSVRQALKTQSPQVIFVEASGLLTATDNRSVKTNITYLPWGKERLSAIFEENLTAEERFGLLFPLYAFHSRWDELKAEDFSPAEPDLLAGYTALFGASPPQKGEVLTLDPAAYERNLQSAKEIVEFCEERSVTVIFFLSPVKEPMSSETVAKLEQDLDSIGVKLWNFQDRADELSLDFDNDFYDEKHLNISGAEKFSSLLATRLVELNVTATEKFDAELWHERVERFHTMKKEGDA